MNHRFPANQRAPLALALACLTLAGCAQATAQVERRNAPDTVVVRSQQEPDKLNPTLTNAISAVDVCTPMFNGLVGVDARMRLYPDLLTVLPTPENGLVKPEGKGMVVTYRLRPGVRFHDGVPLTSRDLVFGWKMHMDPRVMVSSRDGYDQITRIDTPDPLTAVVHFKAPYAPYLLLFSLPNDPVLPAHLLEKSPDLNLDAFNRAPIGTGPFKFKEWIAGDHVGMVANPDYFRGAPKLKKLYFKFIPDDNAAFIQLANGDIDVYADFNLEQLKPAKLQRTFRVENVPSLTYEQITFNLEKPLFKERAVRIALAHAVNKTEMSRTIYKGVWPEAHSTEHPLAWSFNPHLGEPYPHDPAKAKKILDEAGWKLGADGIRAKNGQRLSFTINSTAGRKIREQAELVLQGYFKAIGAEMKIQNVEGGLLFAGYPSGLLQGGKFEAAMYASSGNVDPSSSISNWHTRMIPPEGQNTVRFRDPEMDRVLDQGNRELAQKDRQPLYWRMTEILNREAPVIPLAYWTETHGVNRHLHGFQANPTNSRFIWNVQEWYVDSTEDPQ